NNHRSIDDNPEVDGAEAHQVGIHIKKVHHAEGKEQTEWNYGGNHQSGSHISEQQNHYKNYDQTAQDQVFGNGIGGFFDQLAALQKAIDMYAFGQAFLHLGYTFFNIPDHFIRIGSFKHHH